MKTLQKIITTVVMVSVLLLIYRCEDDDALTTATPILQAALLDVNVPNSLVLDPDLSSSSIITFSWDDADYGIQSQINYVLEVDDTSDFSEPITVSTTTQRSTTLTVSQLNTAVSDAGLAPFQDGTAYVRIQSNLGTQSGLSQYSNAISLNVFPYTTELPRLYVVGDYQENSGYGTTNAEAPTLASSEFGNETNYEGYVYFDAAAEFQLHRAGFVGEYVDGNPIYGDDGGVVTEGATGMLSAPLAGYYFVEVNLDTGSITLTETSWAIAGPGGPSGGWPDSPPDADMTYNITDRVWEFTNASTSSGEFKFRANDDWAINYGTDSDGDGSLDFNGANNFNNTISATAFRLNLSSPRAYSFSISTE